MKSKKILSLILCLLLTLTVILPACIPDRSPARAEEAYANARNDAYLPFGWVYSNRSDGFIREKLELVRSYGIGTVYFSLGTVTLAGDEEIYIDNNIAARRENGLWEHFGHWLKIAGEYGVSVIPIIDCGINGLFNENSGSDAALLTLAITDIIDDVFSGGFVYGGKAYIPEGVHFDAEPFRTQYQAWYLDTLTAMRAKLDEFGGDKTLSAATPAKNTLWKNAYLAKIGRLLDRINPMIYDSNGPSSWGTPDEGVTQSADEYVYLTKQTCLWYSKVFADNGIDCVISPTLPCYPDNSYSSSSERWPENAGNNVYYHLTSVENVENCLKGIVQANELGAGISSVGIWNFYYFCGDAEEFTPEIKPSYDYESAQSAYLSWMKGYSFTQVSTDETAAVLNNPDRGFYRPAYLYLSPEEYDDPWISQDTNIIHLLVGLASLSPVNNAHAEPLFTQNMLDNLSDVLGTLRSGSRSVVIRFAYDDFEGNADMEPSIGTIERHIEQLAPVFEEYADIICSVEAGFIGPWGEMHTSEMAEASVFSRLIDALLDAVPETLTITVRRPKFYADWKGISLDKINKDNPAADEPSYRVGVFNDGYLASESDYGTYADRSRETSWLFNQATHTLFGGEASLLDNDRTYSSIEAASGEMFVTHTAYLNEEWNDTLVGYWKNERYTGSDTLYYNSTAYKYIADHLGYRYTLKHAAFSKAAAGEDVTVDFSVFNSGFGNMIKNRPVQIILKQGEKIFAADTDLDFTSLLSRTALSGSVSIALPDDFGPGECEAYIKISTDKNALGAVAFTNENIYDAELCANLLGTFEITDGSVPAAPVTGIRNIGIGGGGAYYKAQINPTDKDNIIAICDMGGVEYTLDGGKTWLRSEARGAFTSMEMSSDGTAFVSGYGIYAVKEKGAKLELIYPKNPGYSISRMGTGERLMVADGYDNGYVYDIRIFGARLYFATCDWDGHFALRSCDFDGGNPEILYSSTGIYSSSDGVSFTVCVNENGIYFSDYRKIFRLNGSSLDEVYSASRAVTDFSFIDGSFYILDDSAEESKIMKTADFTDFENIAELNTLETCYERWGVTYPLEYHYGHICGTDANNLWFIYGVPDSSHHSDWWGILRFDGSAFTRLIDNRINYRGSESVPSYEGWSYGGYGPFEGITVDPFNPDRCVIADDETVMLLDNSNGLLNIKTCHCTEVESELGTFYSSTGLNPQTTYGVRFDPFNEEHIIICTTDMGMQESYDGGVSFRRMEYDESNYWLYNTCYDLYFDTHTEGLVYGLWCSQHDMPYRMFTDTSGIQGAFGVSHDGGHTWDVNYSTGIPENAVPAKMSVKENGGSLTIAVATFNYGFYVSFDSGRTFTSISDGMDAFDADGEQLIFGEDVAVVGDLVYCLTGYNSFSGVDPSDIYIYNMSDGSLAKVDTGDYTENGAVIARTLTVGNDGEVYVNYVSWYKWDWRYADYFVNIGGGIYRITDENTLEMTYAVDEGIFGSCFASDGTLYAVCPYGTVYRSSGAKLEVYCGGLFNQLKYPTLSPDEKTVYVSTLGGGTYAITSAENLPDIPGEDETTTESDETTTEPDETTTEPDETTTEPDETTTEPDETTTEPDETTTEPDETTTEPDETTTEPDETTTEPDETTTEPDETTTKPSDGETTTKKPEEPATQPGGGEPQGCSHLCHKTGFLGFIWKIVNLFNRLFKINQTCSCGAKHW